MRIKIDIQSRWHVGSGYGDGPGADALVVRTREKLPYLPGKTLKGLLRDGCRLAEDLGHLESGTTNRLFGCPDAPADASDDERAAGMERFLTKKGALAVSSALLGATEATQQQWKQWSQANKGACDVLFHTIHSTALEENGVVKDGSLRSFEFVVPMALYADIEGSQDDLNELKVCLPLVRELGIRRNRGFGRCAITVVENG